MSTAAVLLAAGLGSRFTGPTHKLLAPFRGRPLGTWAAEAALAAGLEEVLVVVQPGGDPGWLPAGVVVVEHAGFAEGQATSLRAGVAAAAERGHDAVVVGLADQPLVPAEAWRRVAVCTDRPICVATYDGQRRNPVRLGAEVWPLLAPSGDEGARALVRARPELVCEVACPGHPVDIDTLEDLRQWSS